MKKSKAFTTLEVLLVVAVIGGVATLLFPKVFNKDSRNAAHSQQATQKLEQAQQSVGSSVASSVTAIGQANADAPASKEKDFIAKEVPLVLSQLPAPDAQKLFEATRRRAAVAEGNLELVNKLYGKATQDVVELNKQLEAAKAYREKVDLELSEAAAYKLGAERTKMALGAVAAILLAGLVYIKVFSITPASMGNIVADIRSGVNPITAIDTHLGPRLHTKVQTAARLATPST